MRKRSQVMVIGSAGMFGSELIRRLPDSVEVLAFDHARLDITDRGSLDRAIAKLQPEWIINAAAYTDVDRAESKSALAFAVNGTAVGDLACAASANGAKLIHISTDYVFSGEQCDPYSEDDPTAPINVYGASKLAGERAIAESGLESAWILRTSWLYGPRGACFPRTIARLAVEREELTVVDDQRGAPTLTSDLADALIALVRFDGAPAGDPGIYHVAGRGECTWYDFAVAIVEELRARGAPVTVREIRPVPTSASPRPARRPSCSTLSLDKLVGVLGGRGIPRPWRTAYASALADDGAMVGSREERVRGERA